MLEKNYIRVGEKHNRTGKCLLQRRLANYNKAKVRLGRASENELEGQAHQYLKEKGMENWVFQNWDSEKQACLREALGDFPTLSNRSSVQLCWRRGFWEGIVLCKGIISPPLLLVYMESSHWGVTVGITLRWVHLKKPERALLVVPIAEHTGVTRKGRGPWLAPGWRCEGEREK